MSFRRLAHAAIVLLTIAAWLVAADHCAIAGALMHPITQAAAGESCPDHAPQPEKKPGQSDLPCCKSFVAAMAPVKVFAGYDSSQFVLQPYLTADFQLTVGRSCAPVAELDTGPPNRRSFAESVLQRSILAHAPPVLG